MHRGVTRFLAVVAISGLALVPAQQVSAQPHPERRVIAKVAPAYPELARRMHLQGAVKLEVGVKADGAVKSTRVLGGNPVLVQAAADAVSKWKFEVAQGETVEIIQLTFEP
ncbi:MAG: energy transducer TonB [Candidatus Sulfotelmatobacter sp.]